MASCAAVANRGARRLSIGAQLGKLPHKGTLSRGQSTSGTFLTGALFFKQGVNLPIEKNGVLKGSVNQDDYPQVKTR